jgi:hypothetical protein
MHCWLPFTLIKGLRGDSAEPISSNISLEVSLVVHIFVIYHIFDGEREIILSCHHTFMLTFLHNLSLHKNITVMLEQLRNNTLSHECANGLQEAEREGQGVQQKGCQIIWQHDFQAEQAQLQGRKCDILSC